MRWLISQLYSGARQLRDDTNDLRMCMQDVATVVHSVRVLHALSQILFDAAEEAHEMYPSAEGTFQAAPVSNPAVRDAARAVHQDLVSHLQQGPGLIHPMLTTHREFVQQCESHADDLLRTLSESKQIVDDFVRQAAPPLRAQMLGELSQALVAAWAALANSYRGQNLRRFLYQGISAALGPGGLRMVPGEEEREPNLLTSVIDGLRPVATPTLKFVWATALAITARLHVAEYARDARACPAAARALLEHIGHEFHGVDVDHVRDLVRSGRVAEAKRAVAGEAVHSLPIWADALLAALSCAEVLDQLGEHPPRTEREIVEQLVVRGEAASQVITVVTRLGETFAVEGGEFSRVLEIASEANHLLLHRTVGFVAALLELSEGVHEIYEGSARYGQTDGLLCAVGAFHVASGAVAMLGCVLMAPELAPIAVALDLIATVINAYREPAHRVEPPAQRFMRALIHRASMLKPYAGFDEVTETVAERLGLDFGELRHAIDANHQWDVHYTPPAGLAASIARGGIQNQTRYRLRLAGLREEKIEELLSYHAPSHHFFQTSPYPSMRG